MLNLENFIYKGMRMSFSFKFFNSLVIHSVWRLWLFISKIILFFSFRPEDSPARYQDEYSKLRSWAYSSLDLYKVN
jgi:hypothetical protein